MKLEPILDPGDSLEAMIRIFQRNPPDDPVNFIPNLEQMLRQVRSVLPGNPCDERLFLHVLARCENLRLREHDRKQAIDDMLPGERAYSEFRPGAMRLRGETRIIHDAKHVLDELIEVRLKPRARRTVGV